MKVKIADGLVKDGFGRNSAKKTGDECYDKQNETQYFPPGLTKHNRTWGQK